MFARPRSRRCVPASASHWLILFTLCLGSSALHAAPPEAVPPAARQARRIQLALEAVGPLMGLQVDHPEGPRSSEPAYLIESDEISDEDEKPGDQTYGLSAQVFTTTEAAQARYEQIRNAILDGTYFGHFYLPPHKGVVFPVATGTDGVVGIVQPHGLNVDFFIGDKSYATGAAIAFFRWQNATFIVSMRRIGTTGYAPDTPNRERTIIAPEMIRMGEALIEPVQAQTRFIHSVLERLRQLDAVPAIGTEGPKVVTGEGTENRIVWEIAEEQARLPLKDVPYDFDSTWQEARPAADLTGLPKVAGLGGGGGPGDEPAFTAKWGLGSNGLRLANVTYDQWDFFARDDPLTRPATHPFAETILWRAMRVRFGNAGREQYLVPSSLNCTDVLKIMKPGVRAFDQKQFSWGLIGLFYPPLVDGPPGSGAKYLVEITQAFLFSTPHFDQDPAGKAFVVKAYPTLTAKIVPLLGDNPPRPSFSADLKLIFAPRRTRRDQARPDDLFLDPPGMARVIGSNVTSLFADTNHEERPLPGLKQPPYWDILFDYGEPDLFRPLEFDAVVYPRSAASRKEFTVNWPGAWPTPIALPNPLRSGRLKIARVPGQGEFDNLHIHPYVGFDDPRGAAETTNRTFSLVEAPLGGDEVMHMHWRWGAHLHDSAAGPHLAHNILGYSSNLSDPQPWHKEPGAPLIPANQSLRIKLGRPDEDDTKPWDHERTGMVYKATVHEPEFGKPNPFFVHGFGLAFHFEELLADVLIKNQELLGLGFFPLNSPVPLPGTSYHALRWATFLGLAPDDRRLWQRVPWAGDIPGLSRNRLGVPSVIGEPPLDLDTLEKKP